ncbi:MAG TPA: alanyl-tRNA editing protein [Thermoplasmata archaeon]|nr:alanyl-tRNA editing protein [Thermoplasmata archaeon]
MRGALYLTDAYLRTVDATIDGEAEGGVVLHQSVFYPEGGGQPGDSGVLRGASGTEWVVSGARKGPTGVVHLIDRPPFPHVGATVRAEIDWTRRYQHMRYHTCLHLLSGAVFRRFGSGITGGQIYTDRARTDFALPEFGREVAEQLIADVNRVVSEARPIHVRSIPRAEAERDPTLVRVAAELMPQVEEVRLIDIEGYDVQADGGTHVRSTAEVGKVRLQKIENKGGRNKRLYLTLDAAIPDDPPALV